MVEFFSRFFSRAQDQVRPAAPAGVAAADPAVAVLDVESLGRGPAGDIAADSASGVVVTTNPVDGTIDVRDADTLAVRTVVPVGGEPVLVAVAEDRAFVATTSVTCDGLTVVDTRAGAVIAAYPVAFSISALTVSPDGKRVYVGRTGGDTADIAVVDVTAERVGSIGIVDGPGVSVDAVRVDQSGRRLYAGVTDLAGSTLVTVDTGTARVIRRLRLPSPIRDIALGLDGVAYVLRSDRRAGGTIDIVDLGANVVTESVTIGGAPTALAVSADGGRAYVVDYDRVVVIDTVTAGVVDEISGAARPSCLAARADGRRLYVADFAGALTALTVPSSALPLSYSHFVATRPVIRRELAAAAV
jgi:YVTN family beta-propeller protein